MDICIFAHLPDESKLIKPLPTDPELLKKVKQENKPFTCIHGKTLSFETARKALRLQNIIKL